MDSEWSERFKRKVPPVNWMRAARDGHESVRHGQTDHGRRSVIATHDAHAKTLPTRLLHAQFPPDRVPVPRRVLPRAHVFDLHRVRLDPHPHPRNDLFRIQRSSSSLQYIQSLFPRDLPIVVARVASRRQSRASSVVARRTVLTARLARAYP